VKKATDSRWKGNREARAFARTEFQQHKGGKYKTKADCYRALIGQLKVQFEVEDTISQQTFTEDWLKGL
jgi:hypothetical protein